MLRFSSRLCQTVSASIPQLVQALQRSPAYLRHTPPTLYVTCDTPTPDPAAPAPQRHRTRLLDAGGRDDARGSAGVYLLSSSSLDDVDFAEATMTRSVLVGLPCVKDAHGAEAFVEENMAHLQHLQMIFLPTIEASHGCVLHALRRRTRATAFTVATSSFGAAFLTDSVFFDGVRKMVLENDTSISKDGVQFAELESTDVQVVADGTVLSPFAVDGQSTSRRMLRVLETTALASRHGSEGDTRRRAATQHYPAYFRQSACLLYDPVFNALLVGSLAWHLPWLTHVVTEARRDLILPMPLLTHAACVTDSALLDTWRVDGAAKGLVTTMRRVPEVQRVLSECFGELPGDVEDVARSLESGAAALEALRNRLAYRLERDTSLDVQRWAAALLGKIVCEVMCANASSEPTRPEVMGRVMTWASQGPLGRLSTVLTQSAMSLPASSPPRTALSATDTNNSRAATSTASPNTAPTRDFTGTAGVRLMKAILAKKGLQGLGKYVEKEEIDVEIFLRMTEADLRKVFKATFGLTKRLESLQAELRVLDQELGP